MSKKVGTTDNRTINKDLQDRLSKTIAGILGISEADVKPSFSYLDTDRWDSFKHMEIITAIEQEFSVSLTAEEIIAMTGIQEIMKVLSQKVRGKNGA